MSEPARTKILYVITKSNWGGAQRYVFDLATALTSEFAVSVAFGQQGLLAKKLREAHMTTFSLQSLQRDVSVVNDVKSFFELLRLFRTERPNVVHLNSSKAGGIGALAARLAGVSRIIFTAHGWPFWENRIFTTRALMYLFSWITALLAHRVIVVSNYDLTVAKQMPFVRHKVVRIYNGIGSLTFGSGDMIRRAFSPGAHITGTVGELTKNKNHIVLIEQAREDSRMCVAIVGEGEERERLESKIKEYGLEDRVKLFGFLPAQEVMRGFDTFALPSIKEGLPYVLLEAKAAGLPLLANRVGGVGEILDTQNLSQFSLNQMVEKTIALYR